MARRTQPGAGRCERGAGRRGRTWPQRILIGVNAVLVIACLAVAGALTKVRTTLEQVPVVDVGGALSAPVDVEESRNILIIGTDSHAGLDKSDPVVKGRLDGENLADVIMILRVNPQDGTARLLSIPRDTRIELPDGSMQRINAAIGGPQGPKTLVQTIKRNFGISIDNYVEVDFAAFKDLVEVLGGVPVYFTTPVRDRTTGLYIDTPGCKMLDPAQSLAYARSRHFEFQEKGKWKTDGTGDLGRITRQQDFIKRAMRRASDQGIRNPSTATGMIDAASNAVVLDDTLNVGTILDLLNQFRSFNPDDLLTEQVPTEAAPRGGVAYQEVIWDQAMPLLVPFWASGGDSMQPNAVIVDVRGSSKAADALKSVSDQLDQVGFDAEPVEARGSSGATTISYGPAGREAAILLARHLGNVPKLVEDDEIIGFRVVLNVGGDVPTVRQEALPVDQLPPGLATTTVPQGDEGATTTTEPGTTSTVEGSTTTTILEDAPADAAPPGIVPTDPEKAAACH
ncbi:LCP family protein [Dermatobacter hominis]|uniref:LCP family protein n=1 Tax=Dermatobacter hominis TaxID=2884263 RepID=UPI001D10F6BE|nr:LCP family protein [Dermatobacter hominis]UDY35592.1 LCP family protein [Dermatobacter hominis]